MKTNRHILKSLKIILVLIFIPCSVSAQQSNNMRLIATLNMHSSGGLYSACWGYVAPNGNEYAILGCAKGTSFLDLRDTNNIIEVGYVLGPNEASCCREIKTYSHYAYVVADGISSGLQIIDLQYLPDSVRLVNTFYFPGFTRGHTIQVENPNKPYLYINAGDYRIGGLFVLDLSVDPVNPVKRGEWEDQVVHDCRVINDTIYACNIYNPPGTISVIDATDKDSLRTVTSWQNLPDPGPHNIAISNDRKFAFITDEIGGNPRLLKIWNIANLNNPVKIAEWQPTGITTSIIHNVELFGNYLFAAHYTAGLRVINVSNPSNPTEAAWYDTYPANNGFTYDGCWGAYVFPSETIIASDRSTGLYVFKAYFPLVIGIQPITTPVSFYLEQNYPNPFNPVTTIKYSLIYNSYVKLTVYDASGRIIKTLADGYSPKGNKSVTFDAKDLASGIYFYRLKTTYSISGKTNEYSESRKMALVK